MLPSLDHSFHEWGFWHFLFSEFDSSTQISHECSIFWPKLDLISKREVNWHHLVIFLCWTTFVKPQNWNEKPYKPWLLLIAIAITYCNNFHDYCGAIFSMTALMKKLILTFSQKYRIKFGKKIMAFPDLFYISNCQID